MELRSFIRKLLGSCSGDDKYTELGPAGPCPHIPAEEALADVDVGLALSAAARDYGEHILPLADHRQAKVPGLGLAYLPCATQMVPRQEWRLYQPRQHLAGRAVCVCVCVCVRERETCSAFQSITRVAIPRMCHK